MKTEQELKQLALDISDGKVFGSWDIPEGQDHMLGSIFMVLLFLTEDQRKEKPHAIYEYFDKAGPRSVNGFPIFMSCHYLSKEETTQLQALVELIHEQKKQFLEM